MSTIDDKTNLETLREWQRGKLASYGVEGYHPHKTGPTTVTVLCYFFRTEESAALFFPYTKCAICETWRHCGAMKTVIVSHAMTKPVVDFANRFPNLVEVQVEPALRPRPPRDLNSMSKDCNSRLHSRFTTDEVLIIQDDGFPVRPLLNRFLGRYDFVGAPMRRPFWYIQLLGRLLRDWPSNGGFSLRSLRMCKLVSDFWNRHYDGKPFDSSQSEDLFYTQTLPRTFRQFRWGVHIAESRPASLFSYDGCLPFRPDPNVFGFHSARGFRAILPDLKD